MVKGRGGLAVKRDLFLLSLFLCLFGGAVVWGAGQVLPTMPAVSTVEKGQWILVLDAGHGGEDGGASTAGGEKESQINLAIVRKTESLMAFLGVETYLTREEDISLHDSGVQTIREKKVSDLKNRVKMINSFPNAMLMSIHQNHFTDSRYSGAQVFYTSRDISRQWGECAQSVLRNTLDLGNDREAKPIPDNIYLFSHVNCPAILVECGFLSNGEEASLLLTDSHQRKLAMALAGAYLHEIQMIPTVWEGE